MHGLKSAAGFVQTKVAERLTSRYVPHITFVLDEGVKKSIEIARLIRERERDSSPPTDAGCRSNETRSRRDRTRRRRRTPADGRSQSPTSRSQNGRPPPVTDSCTLAFLFVFCISTFAFSERSGPPNAGHHQQATTPDLQRKRCSRRSSRSRFAEPPAEPRPLLEELIYAICREGSTPADADAGYARLRKAFIDWNEVRVSTVQEVGDDPPAALRARLAGQAHHRPLAGGLRGRTTPSTWANWPRRGSRTRPASCGSTRRA